MALLRAISLRIPPVKGATQTPLAGPIDFELAEGEAVQLSGNSGSGKTTLLRCVALLEARAEGEVRFRDTLVGGASVPGYRRQVIYVPQTPPRFQLTVEESLRLACRFLASDADFNSERARQMCRDLLLPDDIFERSLPRVSGGEAQRLGIVRALLADPVVLLLDEPTSALDKQSEDAVHALLDRWFQMGGRSLVSISHKGEIPSGSAGQRLVMYEGRLRGAA